MKQFERKRFNESIDKVIASVAHAYGFTNAPVVIAKKQVAGSTSDIEESTLLIAALAGTIGTSQQNAQTWGVMKGKGASHVVYTIANPSHAIAQAFVIKASLTTALSAGFEDCTVLLTSVGDHESRRRYIREINNFFKKNAALIAQDFPNINTQNDPDGAIYTITKSEHPLAGTTPRTIDYLSEPSRKVMLDTIALLESLSIPYTLSPHLSYVPEVHKEVVFAIEGKKKDGTRTIVASGGRFEDHDKKGGRKDIESVMGIAVSVPESLETRDMTPGETPTCFLVHVGEAAKLKAFNLLGSLWDAHIALDQALLTSSIQEQMERAQQSGAKYLTIVGQREALDNTAIMKNMTTQIQETVSVENLITKLSKVRS